MRRTCKKAVTSSTRSAKSTRCLPTSGSTTSPYKAHSSRYCATATSRLVSDGKVDVVDNDAEFMIGLDEHADIEAAAQRVTTALVARGWPPCSLNDNKITCFSLREPWPCKFELYTYTKDPTARLLYVKRECSSGSRCKYDRHQFPFQAWGGWVPWEFIYPLTRCRAGTASLACPRFPLSLLMGWNAFEYAESVSPDEAPTLSGPCLALPVIMLQDRELGDPRNVVLRRDGLNDFDLVLLEGYARKLVAEGFESFAAHLEELPCQRRAALIRAGRAADFAMEF
eukprot:NODE_9416_length_1426_cov_3.020785.p1 GENE.NODE_9416_length_1426_cov_3.020785~~NODE_9416_length_1426_cov_3.020785.p1  ORF type:complete len:283 (-),score=72.14 NODE_9416_length_1426_cov_3.020785:67-915(-)